MSPVVPVLNTVFWVAAPPFVVSLFLSDSTPGLIGDKGLRFVNAALLVVKCSGASASCELARNQSRTPSAGNGPTGSYSTQ
jgi:hypothetical protein